MAKRRHFADSPKKTTQRQEVSVPDEQDKDLYFLALIKAHRFRQAIEMLSEVTNINIVDAETGMTPLHFAAGYRVEAFLEALWTRDDLDELVCDREGRYASELAWQVAGDEVLGGRLMVRESSYAKRTGQKAWPKPQGNASEEPTPN